MAGKGINLDLKSLAIGIAIGAGGGGGTVGALLGVPTAPAPITLDTEYSCVVASQALEACLESVNATVKLLAADSREK